jgi:hypothetical protein
VTTIPYSYWFPDGTTGCVMAETKARAIMTILELNPTQSVNNLSLHIEPEWTSNPLCVSPAVNTCQTRKN